METLARLLDGNAEHAATFDDRFGDVQDGQRPDAVTVCCSDSRVLQDHAFGNDDPGHLFTCSNIGNRVTQRTAEGETVSGDVLYPLVHTGTELAIVLGHTGCGAVTATYDAIRGGLDEPPGIEAAVDLLRPGIADAVDDLDPNLDRGGAVNRLVEYNVDRQVDALLDGDAVPRGVDVVGGVYDFQDVYGGRRGEIHILNVNGERDPGALRNAHPGFADRIDRLREY